VNWLAREYMQCKKRNKLSNWCRARNFLAAVALGATRLWTGNHESTAELGGCRLTGRGVGSYSKQFL
jgi:hypothetical protein